MRRRAAFVLPLAFALVTVACGDPVEDRPASWSYIHAAIIKPNCTTSRCHSSLSSADGIRLETDLDAYFALVQGGFVKPGQPDQSRLLFLLRGEGVSRRMPPDVPLADGDIDLIELWILEGAEDN